MEFNQISYFLNLAETLNFTDAARISGVSQPSLTKSIRKLEDELGGALIYRDGKDSRLTSLGREVQVEFMKITSTLTNVRELAETSVYGRRRTLTLGVAPTIAPNAFAGFIEHVLKELPSVVLNIRTLGMGEGATEVLSGKYDACILPQAPMENVKLAIIPLYVERYLVAFKSEHPLSALDIVPSEKMADEEFIDRLACEFRSQVTKHFMDRNVVTAPRFSSEREDWAQRMVSQGFGICIMPERSSYIAGIDARPVVDMDLSREVTMVAVSGNGTPAELRHILGMAKTYQWSIEEILAKPKV